MPKGPAPLNPALRALRGRSHRARASRPNPARGTVPACPRWMPQAGRALWRRLAPELHAAGLLTVLDLPLLEAFCAAYSRWRAAESAIAELGLTAPSARGSPRPRAEVSIALRERAAMLAAGAALGIGAGARSRMLIEPPPPAPGLLEELLRPVPTGARVELDDLVDEDEDEEPGDEPDGGTAA